MASIVRQAGHCVQRNQYRAATAAPIVGERCGPASTSPEYPKLMYAPYKKFLEVLQARCHASGLRDGIACSSTEIRYRCDKKDRTDGGASAPCDASHKPRGASGVGHDFV
jgi:hypothetical protein